MGVPILDPKIINEIMEGRDPFIINVQFEETEPQQLLLNSEDSLPSPGTSDNELKPPSRYRMNRRREDIPVDSEQCVWRPSCNDLNNSVRPGLKSTNR